MLTPTASFSVMLTVTLWSARASYVGSSALLMTWSRVTSSSWTASPSWAAFTVTVWAVLQLEAVKVSSSSSLSAALAMLRSVPEWPLIVTVTSPAGSEVSLPPCS